MNYTDSELLNWAMNQLYRAARTLQLAAVGAEIREDHPAIKGCDMVAETILNRLKSNLDDLELVRRTNPKLLEQETV